MSNSVISSGSVKALDSVFGLEIEVEFNQVYENQPLFYEIDKFVRNFGFQLFDLKPYYWKRKKGKEYGGLKGQLIFADALYFLDLDHIEKRLKRIQGNRAQKAKILRAISIALLYGYIDYALAIFEKKKSFFNREEAGVFYKQIKKNRHFYAKIPYFRGKGKIAKLFKIFYNKLRYHYNGWAITEGTLGNLE